MQIYTRTGRGLLNIFLASQLSVLTLGWALSAQAQSGAGSNAPWCPSPNPPDTYTAFPAGVPYSSGPASGRLAWRGEDFESYSGGETLECSNSDRYKHFEVTSGCIAAAEVGSYHRAYTEDDRFRVLAFAYDQNQRVKWTDQAISYRAYIKEWRQPDCTTCGLHLFTRYRTENDLYVASLRQDGLVTIKKKLCGVYTTLAQKQFGPVALKTWQRLKFSAIGNRLSFSLNGQEVLAVSDSTFSWGTAGIRTDFIAVYLDDWSVTAL